MKPSYTGTVHKVLLHAAVLDKMSTATVAQQANDFAEHTVHMGRTGLRFTCYIVYIEVIAVNSGCPTETPPRN